MNYKVCNNNHITDSMDSTNEEDNKHNNNHSPAENDCRKRLEVKLKSPTYEDDYIRSEKVHTRNGRATHYYVDEPTRDMLLAVKVNA